jgi:hypothetical protein
MAAPAWKRTLPQARLQCVLARHYLSDALGNLRSPMLLQSRDGEGRYILVDSAKRNVERACMLLSTSVANMVAAELLVLRVCAPVSAQPVADIGYLHDGAAAHHDEWVYLNKINPKLKRFQIINHR